MTLDLKAQVYANPADWTGWLALRNGSMHRQTYVGRWCCWSIVFESKANPRLQKTREWVRLLAETWVEEWRSRLSKDDQAWIDFWMRVAPSLRALTGAPTTLAGSAFDVWQPAPGHA